MIIPQPVEWDSRHIVALMELGRVLNDHARSHDGSSFRLPPVTSATCLLLLLVFFRHLIPEHSQPGQFCFAGSAARRLEPVRLQQVFVQHRRRRQCHPHQRVHLARAGQVGGGPRPAVPSSRQEGGCQFAVPLCLWSGCLLPGQREYPGSNSAARFSSTVQQYGSAVRFSSTVQMTSEQRQQL